MAITSAICTSFKQEILVGTHNFTATSGDTFKIALYTSSATLGAGTTAYSTSNEITNSSGTAYTAVGATLTTVTPTTSGKYLFTFQVKFKPNNENFEDAYASIYKNGSELSNYSKDMQFGNVDQFQNSQDSTLGLSFVDSANGSGDYYELYAYFSESTIVEDAHFSGHKLIGV